MRACKTGFFKTKLACCVRTTIGLASKLSTLRLGLVVGLRTLKNSISALFSSAAVEREMDNVIKLKLLAMDFICRIF